MKLAFVVQRYGLEVNGGAEYHCRLIAESLSNYFDVEVITTCALDYMTWDNYYPEGKDVINGIIVWRFPLDAPRDVEKFNAFSQKTFFQPHTREDEIEWMKLQGPYSTKLLDFIKKQKDSYDFFIFFTYLYCTTFFGLPLAKGKAILVPTAHDELPIHLTIFKEIFKTPIAIVYNTYDEKKFVNSLFNNDNIPSDVVGVWVQPPKNISAEDFRSKYDSRYKFILYIGRVDESKGCKDLFKYFLKYKHETNSDVKLVLLGKSVTAIPQDDDIIPLGFVSETDKYNAILASELLVMPSKYESLSMVLLEGWICKKPCLVNSESTVLKSQCIKSNGGLWYKNYSEFKESLDLLLTDEELRRKLGENGKKFVEKNYSQEVINKKYLCMLEKLQQSK